MLGLDTIFALVEIQVVGGFAKESPLRVKFIAFVPPNSSWRANGEGFGIAPFFTTVIGLVSTAPSMKPPFSRSPETVEI